MKRLRTVLALAMLLASAAARVEAVEWQRLGLAGDWYGTIAAVSLNDWIYTVERGGGLYRTNPYTGQWTQVGYAEFGNTAYLFAVGDWLYTIEYDGSLYRVSPGNGAWEKLGPSGGWLNTVAGVGYPFDAHSGAILTAESGGGLYATSTDGYWMQIGTPVFNNTLSMVVLNGWLYTIETSGSLYQVNPVNGSWRQIGEPAAWLGVIAAAALDGSFYTAESNGYLYQTNPETGERAHLGGPVFGDTTLMVAAAGALYTIENSGSLYRIDVSVPRAAGAGSAQVAPMTPAAMTVDTPAVPVGYAIQRLVSQRVDCVYRGEYDITGVHPQEWRFTTAMAPELPSQTGVRTRFTPDAKPAREYDAEQRLLLISHWPSTASHQTISIEYQATLWTRRLVPVYSRDALFAVTPLDEATRKLYLAPTYLLDYQSQPFQAWLDRNQLRRDRNQSEIDFGRRVFTVIVRQYVTRERAGNIKGEPASVFCQATEADCKVRSTVFAAAMRANGVPTRMLCGIRAESKTADATGDIYGHVRAEFFADNVGWVPIDVNYALAEPRDPMRRFGEDPGDLLVQHVDGDIMLPTDHGPVRCYGLERPAASVRAKETGTVSYRATSWQVEPVPMSAQAAAAIGPEPIEAISTIEPVGVGPSTSAGTTNTQLNINLRPLGDDRFHIDITYDNQGGGARSGTFEGTKDEIRAWLRSLADLPSDALARILNTLDHIGQRRLFPPRGRWTLSTPGNTNIVSP